MTLLKVDDYFEVVFEFFYTIGGLFMSCISLLIAIISIIPKCFQESNMIFELLYLCLHLLPIFFHFNTIVTFMYQSVKVLLFQASDTILFKEVNFFFFLFFKNNLDFIFIYLGERV